MSNYRLILGLAATFIIGVIATILFINNAAGLELPSATAATERLSPSNYIQEEDIHVFKNGVAIDLKDNQDSYMVKLNLADAQWSTFTDTNSMDPVIDSGSNAIRIKVPCEEIKVGDIITYKHSSGLIIHRVVHIDNDEEGTYFVLKGDNNPTNDPGKVRCEQIQGKIVAILY